MTLKLRTLDQDLLALLQERDERLRLIMHEATKYRSILRGALPRLRHGADPALTRVTVEAWETNLRKIKRLAGEL